MQLPDKLLSNRNRNVRSFTAIEMSGRDGKCSPIRERNRKCKPNAEYTPKRPSESLVSGSSPSISVSKSTALGDQWVSAEWLRHHSSTTPRDQAMSLAGLTTAPWGWAKRLVVQGRADVSMSVHGTSRWSCSHSSMVASKRDSTSSLRNTGPVDYRKTRIRSEALSVISDLCRTSGSMARMSGGPNTSRASDPPGLRRSRSR